MNRTHGPGKSPGVADEGRELISGSYGKLFVHGVGLIYHKH